MRQLITGKHSRMIKEPPKEVVFKRLDGRIQEPSNRDLLIFIPRINTGDS
jgi:hypothetical protein